MDSAILPCLGPPEGGKFLTRRAEGGLGPGGPPDDACAAAAAAATAAAAAATFGLCPSALDEDVAGDAVVAVAVVAVVASAAVEEELLLVLSNIPGGDGSITTAHPFARTHCGIVF